MIDFKSDKLRRFLSDVHSCAKQKYQKASDYVDEDVILENQLFGILCLNADAEPREYADKLNEIVGSDLRGYDIIRQFRKFHISHRQKRRELLDWADELAKLLIQALNSSDPDDYLRFKTQRKADVLTQEGSRYKLQERIGVLMIYCKHPELDIYNDLKLLEHFKNAYANDFLDDLTDALARYCNAIKRPSRGSKNKATVSAEDANYEIEHLKTLLERNERLTQALQDEFEESLRESKTKELTEFFSRLNSEKYGCILDGLLSVRKGVNTLKKNHYELPPELSGLFIITQKLIQFVRDSHIDPIMKLDDEKIVKASDIEFCDYEGTPFADKDDEKIVRVISPGWMYTDKDIQIARPKIKELGDDD